MIKRAVLLTCLLCGSFLAFAQQGTITLSGQFSAAVWGFAPLTLNSAATVTQCQPGPSPAFSACALPPMALGVPYSVTLATIGPKTSVTCTLTGTLPAGLVLTSQGTTCIISGTPTLASATPASFSISFTGQ